MPDPENPLTKISSVDFFTGTAGCVAITNKGIAVRGALTYEEWQRALFGILWLKNMFHIASADLIGHGRRAYGEVLVQETLEQMEFPLNDAKRAEAIARVPWGARDEALTGEHYYVAGAASLSTEKVRQWLDTAREEKLTPLELKRSIEAGKVQHAAQTQAGMGSGSGIVTIQGIRMLFVQWRRENGERILTGPIETQQRLLDEMQPLVELIDQLRHHLSKN